MKALGLLSLILTFAPLALAAGTAEELNTRLQERRLEVEAGLADVDTRVTDLKSQQAILKAEITRLSQLRTDAVSKLREEVSDAVIEDILLKNEPNKIGDCEISRGATTAEYYVHHTVRNLTIQVRFVVMGTLKPYAESVKLSGETLIQITQPGFMPTDQTRSGYMTAVIQYDENNEIRGLSFKGERIGDGNVFNLWKPSLSPTDITCLIHTAKTGM